MEDYTLDANECPGAVKKPGFSVKRCLLLLVLVLAGAFAYWRYGVDRPEDVIIDLLERYHNSSSAAEFGKQTIETTIGKVSPLLVIDSEHNWPLSRHEGTQGAVVFARYVVVEGDKATVTVSATKGEYPLVDRLAMRWFGLKGRIPKGGASFNADQVYHVVKVNGKWVPEVTDADIERVCVHSRRILAAAAEQYRMLAEKRVPKSVQEMREKKLLKAEPKCPAGGTYSIEADPDPSKYTCTVKCSKHR